MNKINLFKLAIFILVTFIPNYLIADDYDPYPDNEKTIEFAINGGYSIITHEKSFFWDNGFNFGLGFNFYVTQEYVIGLTANYIAYIPRPEQEQIERDYEYEIYPLILNFQKKLGNMNDLEVYGGIGVSYIYGEYQVDEFIFSTNTQRVRLRNQYASHGFGIIPNFRVRSPFGQDFAVDFQAEYNMIFMESRNNAVLSLDHINAKLALVYIF